MGQWLLELHILCNVKCHRRSHILHSACCTHVSQWIRCTTEYEMKFLIWMSGCVILSCDRNEWNWIFDRKWSTLQWSHCVRVPAYLCIVVITWVKMASTEWKWKWWIPYLFRRNCVHTMTSPRHHRRPTITLYFDFIRLSTFDNVVFRRIFPRGIESAEDIIYTEYAPAQMITDDDDDYQFLFLLSALIWMPKTRRNADKKIIFFSFVSFRVLWISGANGR